MLNETFDIINYQNRRSIKTLINFSLSLFKLFYPYSHFLSRFEPDVDPELQKKFDRITAAFSDKATLAMYKAELKAKREWDATLEYAIKERVKEELKKLGINK